MYALNFDLDRKKNAKLLKIENNMDLSRGKKTISSEAIISKKIVRNVYHT